MYDDLGFYGKPAGFGQKSGGDSAGGGGGGGGGGGKGATKRLEAILKKQKSILKKRKADLAKLKRNLRFAPLVLRAAIRRKISAKETQIRATEDMIRRIQARIGTRRRIVGVKSTAREAAASVPAGSSAVVQRGILSVDEETLIKQLIEALKARGVDEDVAEEAAKEKVLPPQKRRFFPPGFFRGIRRAGPRPVLPQTQQQYFAPVPGTLPMPTRSIDPTLQQMSIDPRIAQHDIDPFIRQQSIDPYIYQQSLVPQSGAFTFPPGNLSDVDPDTIIDIEGFGGFVENVKDFVSKPWVIAGLGVAALLYGSKAVKRKKFKSNPKRRRLSRRRR